MFTGADIHDFIVGGSIVQGYMIEMGYLIHVNLPNRLDDMQIMQP